MGTGLCSGVDSDVSTVKSSNSATKESVSYIMFDLTLDFLHYVGIFVTEMFLI
jgi:hypothetical protein